MIKGLAALACALAVLGAIGCGGDDKASDGTDKASSSNAGTVDSTEPITITVWDWSVPDPKVMKKIDDAYEAKHPNVTIKRVHQGFANYFTLLRSAIAARKGPDVFRVFASPFVQDFKNGILPLNDLVTPEDKENLAGWDYLTDPDGDILGMPFTGGGTQFYYNKALFKEAGLDPEAPPKTWDELLAQCDALKRSGIVPISAGWKDGYYAEWWMGQIAHQYQTDEEIAQAVNEPDWASPAIGKAFDLLVDLKERGCFTPNSEAIPLFTNTIDAFKAGKAAIFLGLPSTDLHWGAFRDTKWGRENLGTFLAPLVPDSLWDEQRINFAPSNASSITRWTEHPEVVYDYISHVSSAESQDLLAEEVGGMSNHKQSTAKFDDPVANQIVDWTKTANPYAGQQLLIRAPVESMFVKFVPQIMTGEITYDEIADQIVAEHEKAAGR